VSLKFEKRLKNDILGHGTADEKEKPAQVLNPSGRFVVVVVN
jgi:hypothetical protein